MLHVSYVHTQDGAGAVSRTEPKSAQLGNKGQPLSIEEWEELVGSNPTQRNWRGIIIALLVIIVIISCVAVAVKLSAPDLEFGTLNKFTFEDMFDADMKARLVSGAWVTSETEEAFAYRDEKGDLMKLSTQSKEPTLLLDNRTLSDMGVTRFALSSNFRYALLATKEIQVYRHSFLAVYIIYDLDRREQTFLNPPGKGPEEETYLQYAGWSPEDQLVFVYENDIYYQYYAGTEEATRVTADGVPNLIYNGIPDWLYEEEILSSNVAIWWTDDGKYFCYLTVNDTDVPMATYMDYDYTVYSDVVYIPYPKAGASKNPVATFTIYDTINHQHLTFGPPDQFADEDHYITSVSWTDNNRVAVIYANRLQTHTIIMLCQANVKPCEFNYEEKTPNGWFIINTPLLFTENGGNYFTKLPRKQGSRGDFKHIAMITAPGKGEGDMMFLTDGLWEVIDILGVDEDLNRVYYTSGEIPSPRAKHLWYVQMTYPYDRVCMTCNITSANCSYVDVMFNRDSTWYVLNCQGPGLPQSTMNKASDFSTWYVFENNSRLAQKLEGKAVPEKIYLNVPVEGYSNPGAAVQLIVPANMDYARKHPLLIDVYGGPGSQKVKDVFQLGWPAYLTSQFNVIVASIDGRGSGAYGDKFMYEVYRKFGTVEIDDQIAGAEYIKRLNFIDSKKAAIWGWSYGGFASLMALGSGNSFSCGMAVGSVTDWRYYDTAYTERYMGYPSNDDNIHAYRLSNVSEKAENYLDKDLLLVHGLADDNVHFQNTANLVKALTQFEVDYRTQFYTDKAHDLLGLHTRRHLYRLLTNHLKECLNL
ncbi:inactive dipeptidyl peptidase 10-like isoform X8 [Ptychodera flava]|uniref:inactive dipeptidyl peptidase 10-like isoform X8 n=1 Tax=Ptychodera flava TaxID=63121 RepID=UPI00396A859F